jgi:two-component system LytT family response regulator
LEKLKIIIVDDETHIRSALSHVIRLHYPGAVVLAEAENIEFAQTAIQIHKPDVVLLDIKMPGGTGFDLLKQLMPVNFKIIFITAFDQFALKAFKFSAIDYLLKPVVPEELVTALDKVKEKINQEHENTKLKVFVENLKLEEKKIVLNTQEAIHIISINEIVRCEADRNYTRFFLSDKKVILVSGGLKEYEEMLGSDKFIRPHHSHLVNILFISRLDKRNNDVLILKDGSEVPVSVRKHSDLLAILNRF